MVKKLETTVMGYIGTTVRIHSFTATCGVWGLGFRSVGFRAAADLNKDEA